MQVFGVVGWKNNGKTTLVERLVGHLTGLWLPGVDRQARPSRGRSRPARQGQLAPSRGRGAGGGARHGAPLGGDPRAARGSRAAARRPARPDDAGGPGDRRRLQALLPPQAGGASPRARHSAAGRRGRLDRGARDRRAHAASCACRSSTSTTCRPSPTSCLSGQHPGLCDERPSPRTASPSAAIASPWARRTPSCGSGLRRSSGGGKSAWTRPRACCLAEPLISERDVPAFDNAAVDGFAFAFAEGMARGRGAPGPGAGPRRGRTSLPR